MKKSVPNPLPLSRRTALAGAGTVGALALAAAALPIKPTAAPGTPGAAPDAPADTQQGRYQVTQHVLRYYETTRI